MSRTLFISAGESSGDLHGAHLAQALRQQDPSLRLYGMGSELMRSSGVEILHDPTKNAFIGFIDVITHIGYFKKLFRAMVDSLERKRPDAVILIDYPGFNLRLAHEAKKRGIKVFYYISPQVWAWARKRITKMRGLIDHMFVIFKFEEELFRANNIPVTFVGHPLLDSIQDEHRTPRGAVPAPESDTPLTLAVLPGSREKEVLRHLPVMLETAALLKKTWRTLECRVIQSPSLPRAFFKPFFDTSCVPITLIDQDRYTALASSHFALVCSGTATLETAILGVPMIVVYKVAWLNWLIGKALIKIPDLALVNVVAQNRIVPEYIQHKAVPQKIAHTACNLLRDKAALARTREALARVKASLGAPGAAHRAAEKMIALLLK